MSNQSTPISVSSKNWEVSKNEYKAPKVNERGAKSVNVIYTPTKRSLHLETPLMMTWGISDFVNDAGESDGKYKLSLNFPSAGYETPETTEFLDKLKAFENDIIEAAVKNSELWFGRAKTREVVEDNLFSFIKYSKNKLTKQVDYTKSPSISIKVPKYGDRWGIQLYDTRGQLIFPCDNPNVSPIDLVPKQSQIKCIIQCGGLWFGGKGWGLTWKLTQCVVKPTERVSIFDRCFISLNEDEMASIEKKQPVVENDVDDDDTQSSAPEPVKVASTTVEDSDEEAEEEEVEELAQPVVKKVVKKVAAPPVEAVAAVSAEPVKKKVVKKKV
jgi:hypothetical protein